MTVIEKWRQRSADKRWMRHLDASRRAKQLCSRCGWQAQDHAGMNPSTPCSMFLDGER